MWNFSEMIFGAKHFLTHQCIPSAIHCFEKFLARRPERSDFFWCNSPSNLYFFLLKSWPHYTQDKVKDLINIFQGKDMSAKAECWKCEEQRWSYALSSPGQNKDEVEWWFLPRGNRSHSSLRCWPVQSGRNPWSQSGQSSHSQRLLSCNELLWLQTFLIPCDKEY